MNSRKIQYLFFGIIAALGALVVEIILSIIFTKEVAELTNQLTLLLFLLVITEESFKFSIIYKSISVLFFFLPSFFISLGFALTEISLAYSHNAQIPQTNLYWLLAGVGIIHLITGLIEGYAAFVYKKTKRFLFPFLLFFLAISLHLIYNVAIIKLVKN